MIRNRPLKDAKKPLNFEIPADIEATACDGNFCVIAEALSKSGAKNPEARTNASVLHGQVGNTVVFVSFRDGYQFRYRNTPQLVEAIKAFDATKTDECPDGDMKEFYRVAPPGIYQLQPPTGCRTAVANRRRARERRKSGDPNMISKKRKPNKRLIEISPRTAQFRATRKLK